MKKACSSNVWINASVAQMHAILSSRWIAPELLYIESAKNPADPISRGILDNLDVSLALGHCFPIPEEFNDILSYV